MRQEARNPLIVRREGGLGDVIAVSSLLPQIKIKHPLRPIIVETHFPEVFLHNPYVSDIRYPQRGDQWKAPDYDLDPCRAVLGSEHGKTAPMLQGFADFVKLDAASPVLYFSDIECNYAKSFGRYLVLVARSDWAIRDYLKMPEVVPFLRQWWDGDILILNRETDPAYPSDCIDLRGKTTLRQAMAIIKAAAGCVVVDTGLMHVAGACNTPSVAVCGPVAGWSRCFGSVVPLDTPLACGGCYNRRVWNSPLPYLGCARENYRILEKGKEIPACMQAIEPEQVSLALMKYLLQG